MKVVFISAEVYPFSKVGGLGDVLGGLPDSLANHGVDVKIITPLYASIDKTSFDLKQIKTGFDVKMAEKSFTANIYKSVSKTIHPNHDVYFIDNQEYFRYFQVYTDNHGNPYNNNPLRFLFFQKAALQFIINEKWNPDIIHCHDNHTAVVPLYTKTTFSELAKSKTILTLHNIAYQGMTEMKNKEYFDLPDENFYPMSNLEWYGQINPLKSGILLADELTTVSLTHAREISGDNELGAGMKHIINERKKPVRGIVNGVDYSVWNPETDTFIYQNYSIKTLHKKKQNKKMLLKESGFAANLEEKPVVGMVSRLVEQKGIDLILDGIEKMLSLDLVFILLGSGETRYHSAFKKIKQRFPDKFFVDFEYNNALSHKILAGCDIFLMPSRFEPCGITQMYSLKYGTAPLVRKTGGLADTVINWDKEQGNGFVFNDYTADSMLEVLARGLQIYRDKNHWNKLVKNGMKQDFSWDRSAKQYIQLYENMLK